ncbi:MAG: (2Fe-2S)-binding protein [Nitrospinota bacterium]
MAVAKKAPRRRAPRRKEPPRPRVRMRVNGQPAEGECSAHTTLLYFLRDQGFTEVKNGCEMGDCGACVVMLDGVAVNACMVLALQAEGREVMTVKGLGTADHLHPLQRNFIDLGAIQCGFCTPGILISARALLDKVPNPTREDIKAGIAGNLCRCTGYVKIIDAIEATSRELQAARKR